MALNNRGLSTLGGEIGWPYNYGTELRNFDGVNGPMSIPRFKFTYLVEFKLNPRVRNFAVTNLEEFISNGKIYTQLKRIDHPKPEIKYETLRSYNKWIKVPTVMEFQGASMTFDDDSTAVTQSLWKEYMHFYSHLATVGQNISAGATSNLSSSDAGSEYQYTERLVGEEMRSGMGIRPSLGMKLKPNDMRHFFDSIVIYDLGTEPDAVNVYWFHHPVITSWDHENLDEEDRTNKLEITANFEYESYYWTFGQNRGRLRDYITTILGFFPNQGSSEQRKSGIGRHLIANNRSQSVDTTESVSRIFANNPTLGDRVSGIPDIIGQENTADDSLTFPTSEGTPAETFGAPESVLGPFSVTELLPSTIPGKEAQLKQIEQEQEQISSMVIDPNTSQGAAALRKNAKLSEKKEELVSALTRQRESLRGNDLKNPNTQSALQNTTQKFGGTQPTPNPVIPNPQAAQVVNSANNAVARTQNAISGVNNEISALRQERIEAVLLGDNARAENINAKIAEQISREDQLTEQLLQAIDEQAKVTN